MVASVDLDQQYSSQHTLEDVFTGFSTWAFEQSGVMFWKRQTLVESQHLALITLYVHPFKSIHCMPGGRGACNPSIEYSLASLKVSSKQASRAIVNQPAVG